MLSAQVPYVKRVIEEADGIQPHLVAPEAGYRRLLEEALGYLKDPTEKSVEEVSGEGERLGGLLITENPSAGELPLQSRPAAQPALAFEPLQLPLLPTPRRPCLGVCAAAPHGGQHRQQ